MLAAHGCSESATPRDPDDDDDDRDAATEERATPDASQASGGDASTSTAGAGGRAPVTAGSGGSGGSTPIPIVPEPPPECADVPVGQLPSELSCTGLYADIASKELAAGVRFFAPSHHLWSDGADKQRWIYLPEGTQIDSSVSDDWQFPVGTKLFKEFSWDGHRVETRLFWKSGEGRWLKTAYHWNEDETEATRFAGGEVDVAGYTYYIPSPKECDQCHKGRDDRALGFELVSLALAGAEGLTLSELVSEGLLSQEPRAGSFEIGDDGTGKAAAALGWLHVNCGVSCHNDNSASEGFSSDLRLRLPAEAIDGSSSAEFEAIATTVGIPAQTPRWLGRTRIVAGSPEDSLLYVLAGTRDPANPKDQMPPIASRMVDSEGLVLIEEWIRSMP